MIDSDGVNGPSGVWVVRGEAEPEWDEVPDVEEVEEEALLNDGK